MELRVINLAVHFVLAPDFRYIYVVGILCFVFDLLHHLVQHIRTDRSYLSHLHKLRLPNLILIFICNSVPLFNINSLDEMGSKIDELEQKNINDLKAKPRDTA